MKKEKEEKEKKTEVLIEYFMENDLVYDFIRSYGGLHELCFIQISD